MTPVLQVRRVSKRYGNQIALSDVSFEVQPSRMVGLLGPNGSGKTTLIKIINNLITDYEGEVLIGENTPGIESKREVSYLPDRMMLPDWLKVKDILHYYKDFFVDFDMERAQELLEALQLDQRKRISTMSKGAKEKLQISLVMARRAKLYVLDEPIAGVDPAAREFIMKTIMQSFTDGSSILLSTHIIGEVEVLFDDVIFLKNGEIVLQDAAEDIRAREGKSIDELFREVFR